MIEEQSFKVPPTAAELKAGTTNVSLDISDAGMFRACELCPFEVEGVTPDSDPERNKIKVALRPFQMFADSEPQDEASAYGVLLKITLRNNKIIERFIAGADE